MKIYKFALPLLLIFIILISSSIACAEEISEDYSLNYGNDEFSFESSDLDNLDNSDTPASPKPTKPTEWNRKA